MLVMSSNFEAKLLRAIAVLYNAREGGRLTKDISGRVYRCGFKMLRGKAGPLIPTLCRRAFVE